MTATANAVALLDQASKKAWNYRSRVMAISAAEDILDAAPAADIDTAYTAWCRAVGYDGPREGLAKYLKAKYRNPGDIALSLTRAALMAELEARAAL